MASGAGEPALRLALLDYVRDVDAAAPVAPAVQTSWLVLAGQRRVELVPATLEAGAR